MRNIVIKIRLCITLLLLLSFISLQSCEDKKEEATNFSDIPKIEFLSSQLLFGEHLDGDTLLITIKYQDGDGDLGLPSGFFLAEYPYHKFNYFNGEAPYEVITDLDNFNGDLLKLGDKPDGMDTLPAYNLDDQIHGIDCINYRLIKSEEDPMHYDTVYIQRNENYYNFYLDFFIKSEDGYVEFDFLKEACVPTDGRFPKDTRPENFPFVIHKSGKQEGTMIYKFTINRIQRYFGGKTFKVSMSIKDQALNESNVVESGDIYMAE